MLHTPSSGVSRKTGCVDIAILAPARAVPKPQGLTCVTSGTKGIDFLSGSQLSLE